MLLLSLLLPIMLPPAASRCWEALSASFSSPSSSLLLLLLLPLLLLLLPVLLSLLRLLANTTVNTFVIRVVIGVVIGAVIGVVIAAVVVFDSPVGRLIYCGCSSWKLDTIALGTSSPGISSSWREAWSASSSSPSPSSLGLMPRLLLPLLWASLASLSLSLPSPQTPVETVFALGRERRMRRGGSAAWLTDSYQLGILWLLLLLL